MAQAWARDKPSRAWQYHRALFDRVLDVEWTFRSGGEEGGGGGDETRVLRAKTSEVFQALICTGVQTMQLPTAKKRNAKKKQDEKNAKKNATQEIVHTWSNA